MQREAYEEVLVVKEALAKGKVGVGLSRIQRGMTYDERELPGQWAGLVTGMGMANNPFMKAGKKKKKKKKKK